jgi:hypothetical protein
MSDKLTAIQESVLSRMVNDGMTIIDNGRVEWSDGSLTPKGVLGRLLRKGFVEQSERREINSQSLEVTYRPTKQAYEYFGETK